MTPIPDPAAEVPAVRVVNVSKTYTTGPTPVTVLSNVSFDVAPGQLVMLIGPSGSGKTTLLGAVSGLVHPDAGGNVYLHGTSLWDLNETQRENFRRERCGFVFQSYNLFPAFTAVQQLEIALAWASSVPAGEIHGRAVEILTQLGLADRLYLRPEQLSGGERQRVAVARAMAKRPALIFADEPTAALDRPNAEVVIGMLRRAANEDRATTLVVTHDQRLMPYADRVIHLEDGRLLNG